MDERVEKIKEELGKSARKIHNIYENSTHDELNDTRRQLAKLQYEIEDIFRRNLGIVPSKVIANLTEQTQELMKKEIESSRLAERNENITRRLGRGAMANSVQEASQSVQEFSRQGAYVTKDFEEKTDEVFARVIKAYKTVLDQHPSQRADAALNDIRGRCRGTFNRIQETHLQNSEEIKRQIADELKLMGLVITNVERQEIDKKVDTELQSFADKLAGSVKSPDDVIKNDVKEISENQAAFRDTPARPTSRSDLEAMFK